MKTGTPNLNAENKSEHNLPSAMPNCNTDDSACTYLHENVEPMRNSKLSNVKSEEFKATPAKLFGYRFGILLI